MFFPEFNTPDAQIGRHRKPTKVATLDPNAVGCNACTLQTAWGTITSPKMTVSGNTRDPDILVLGEAPGAEEDAQGRAMVGPSGKLLREHLPAHLIARCAFQNIVRCRPDNNRTPTLAEAHACSVHLDADIEALPIKAILGTGAVPLRKWMPSPTTIGAAHGLKIPIRVGSKTLWYYPVMHPAYILQTQRENGWDSPALPVFRADLKRFAAEVDHWGKPRVHSVTREDVIVPTSKEEALGWIAKMREPIGFDLESANLKFSQSEVKTANFKPYIYGATWLTAALSDGNITIAFPCNHPHDPNPWGVAVVLETLTKRRWIAHNAAMELLWLLYYNDTGLDLAPFDDSMAIARVLFEREARRRILALEQVSTIILGINVKDITGVDAEHILDYPLSDVLPYNGHDAWASARIYHQAINAVHPLNYQRFVDTVESNTMMELQGLPVDLNKSYALQEKWTRYAANAEEQASKLYEVRQFTADRGIEFNLGSAAHVGLALTAYGKLDLPRTANFGKPGNQPQYVTDDDVLDQYVDTNPLAKYTLEYRRGTKNNSTYVQPCIDVPKLYVDGVLHSSYSSMFVSTTRLSSQDPNIQNWPNRNAEDRLLKEQIVACVANEHGVRDHLMVKFDFGQLEARILAMAAKCPTLCANLINKFDIHSYWLDKILYEYYPEYWTRLIEISAEDPDAHDKIRKNGRDVIKSDFVFSSLYGANAESASNRTKIPLMIVNALLGEFWEEYRAVKVYHKQRRVEYDETGGVTLLTGLKRHGIMTGNGPINTPIQGSGAVIVVDAMNELTQLAKRQRNPYLFPRINIHDDLTFILPNDDSLKQYIDYIADVLVKVRYPWQIVPLTVEVSIGEDWPNMQQITTIEGDYVR